RVVIDITRNVVSIYAADYMLVLKESFTHIQFRNITTSRAVQEIGHIYGLDVTNVHDSGTLVGSAYGYEAGIEPETIRPQGLNNLDLVNKFADFDGYKVFTVGKSLYYVPYEAFKDVIKFEL